VPMTSIFTMAALCQEYISCKGYLLQDEAITPSLADEIEAMPGRAPITELLSPFENDFTSRNSFWLTLRWQGNLVGTLGARFDDIADDDIRDHLTRLHNRHYGSEGHRNVISKLPASSSAITGGLVSDVSAYGSN
jgi:hypothetical protein